MRFSRICSNRIPACSAHSTASNALHAFWSGFHSVGYCINRRQSKGAQDRRIAGSIGSTSTLSANCHDNSWSSHRVGFALPFHHTKKTKAHSSVGITECAGDPAVGMFDGYTQFFLNSRLRACNSGSPGFTFPPGNSQYPAYGLPSGRLARRNEPSTRIIMATATSTMRSGSIAGGRLKWHG